MKTILVPTDFSKNALNAVKYAINYAEKTKSKIILFNSYDSPVGEMDIPFTYAHVGKQEAKQAAEDRMKKLMLALLKNFPKSKLKWFVQPGTASENITVYAKQNEIPLIIMGTTGMGAMARTLLGSTTSAVIADAPCTMMAVSPKAKFKGINRIAVATDLESESFSAAVEAVLFAKQHRAAVTLVHVQDLRIFNSEAVLQKMVDKIKKQTKYKNVAFYLCRDSNVADGLDLFIRKNKPDALSMMTYSRKFPETIWEKSWTDKMSHHVAVPLLVLHKAKAKTDKKTVKRTSANSLAIA